MRIDFLNLAKDEDWGGGEKWTLTAARGLAERGHRVRVIGREGSRLVQRARGGGSSAVGVSAGMDYAPGTILKLAALFQRDRPDVLVVHHNKDVRTGGAAAKMLGVPVVHRNGFPILRDNFRHRLSFRLTDRILTNSERIRARYRSFGWIGADRIDVVPNGIEVPVATEKERNIWDRWNFDPGALVAVYAGRLTEVKRVGDLLEVWESLDADSRWRLVIIGTGPLEPVLRERVRSRGLGDRVRLTGFQEQSQILIGIADLVVLPSSEEGMPNVLMEAMARGVPVAATPVGDVPFLLGDGSAGWLVPVGDEGAWRKLLEHLEGAPSELKRMGTAGRARIETDFTLSRMMDGIESSLARAVAKKKSTSPRRRDRKDPKPKDSLSTASIPTSEVED